MSKAATRDSILYPHISGGVWGLALAAAAGGAVLAYNSYQQMPDEWLKPYLIGWLTWTGLAVGNLSLVLLHNLTGGKWGDAARPVMRAAAASLWLMPVLFIPIFLGTERIYPWADPSVVEHDPILQHKSAYLNVDFFRIRAGVYFIIWLGLLAFLGWQERNTLGASPKTIRRIARFSGQGLMLNGLAVTFASIDWMMSLEPHWFSTIYGVMVFVSFGLAGLAFTISFATLGIQRVRDRRYLLPDPSHDLGKLLFAFVMLWAYMSFSQFLIIWYGNLPEEVVWYIKRFAGDWRIIAFLLLFLHFIVPFVILLGREWKRNPVRLSMIALLLVAMYWLNLVWLIAPALQDSDNSQFEPWPALGFTLLIGGLWLVVTALLLIRGHDTYNNYREVQHG
jgi:hypothetical protein